MNKVEDLPLNAVGAVAMGGDENMARWQWCQDTNAVVEPSSDEGVWCVYFGSPVRVSALVAWGNTPEQAIDRARGAL